MGATLYERRGWSKSPRSGRQETTCRVSDQTGEASWRCVRHSRHIITCLNRKAESELAALRVLRDALGAATAPAAPARSEGPGLMGGLRAAS